MTGLPPRPGVGGPKGACRECNATVYWVRLDSGKRMPVELAEDEAGTVAVLRDVQGGHCGHVLRKGELLSAGERLHMSHFAVCPTRAAKATRTAAAKASGAPTPQQPSAPLPANVVGLDNYRRQRRPLPRPQGPRHGRSR